ncbi:MAG: hypothetical protein LBK95_12895 [Bifidobacteriaceae bacterium]|jgi:hypothetical protein|nr:hypothetical protein [Bifidobacteriaceae bacterium]
MAFDFSTWDRKVTRSDLRDYYRSQAIPFHSRRGFLVALALLGLAVLTAIDVLMTPRLAADLQNSKFALWVAGGTAFLALLIVWSAWWSAGALRRDVLLNKFCQANGMNFRALTRDYVSPGTPFASRQNDVTSRPKSVTRPVLSTSDFTTVIGRHQVENHGNGTSDDFHLPFTFAMSRLPREVPHMILKNRRSRIVKLSQSADVARMRLEDGFPDTFVLYCAAGYERDALHIFTPEVMAACLDLAGNAEIELVDNSLFIYTRSATPFRDPEQLASFLGLAERLTATFAKQTGAYWDDPAEAHNQVALRAPAQRSWPDYPGRGGRVAANHPHGPPEETRTVGAAR